MSPSGNTSDASGMQDAIAAGRSGAVKRVTASATLGANDTMVFVTIPGTGNITITLPPIAHMVGKFVVILAVSGAGSECLVEDAGDGIGTDYDLADNLSAAGDYVMLYCSPLRWIELSELST